MSAEANEAIVELLLFRTPTNFKLLHFFNNMSGSGGAVALERLLLNSPTLEDFRLSSTRCGIEGGIALSRGLASCSQLRKLDLCDNTFGVEGGIQLGKALSVMANLVHLNLRDLGIKLFVFIA